MVGADVSSPPRSLRDPAEVAEPQQMLTVHSS